VLEVRGKAECWLLDTETGRNQELLVSSVRKEQQWSMRWSV
jgi:hypothetical protein